MTATAPHDAFRHATQLTMIDASIQTRHDLLNAAIYRLDLTAALRLVERRDEALDERHALTKAASS